MLFSVWCAVLSDGKRVGRFQPYGTIEIEVEEGETLDETIGNAMLVLEEVFEDTSSVKLVRGDGTVTGVLTFDVNSVEHLIDLIPKG
jgi:hypothetical protein